MSELQVERVAIVGGGTAGWLAALFLKRFLPSLDITVYDPPAIAALAVGESTNGPFTTFLYDLGISDADMIRECGSTLKFASEFEDWHAPGAGYKWVHEFQSSESHLGLPMFHYWMRARREGLLEAGYQESCFMNAALVEHCKVPFAGLDDIRSLYHGFHLETPKFIDFLRRRATGAGVRVCAQPVLSVDADERGVITAINTEAGATQTDFVIDASGWRRAVYAMVHDVAFVSAKDHLLVDSAVATWLPPSAQDVRPSTLGTAAPSGWIWDIPLRDKVSFGYVYASEFESAQSAQRHLLSFLGASEETDVVRLRWTPGALRDPWKANCVCIGLAHSFYEPIESLTSATLVYELRTLLRLFPDKRFDRQMVAEYNRRVGEQATHNRDYISLHYLTTGREDSAFWRAWRQDMPPSEAVVALLEGYRNQAPHLASPMYDLKAFFGMFTSRNIVPKHDVPLLDHIGLDRALPMMHQRLAINRGIPTSARSHADFLDEVAAG